LGFAIDVQPSARTHFQYITPLDFPSTQKCKGVPLSLYSQVTEFKRQHKSDAGLTHFKHLQFEVVFVHAYPDLMAAPLHFQQ